MTVPCQDGAMARECDAEHEGPRTDIRPAALPTDRVAVRALWLEYLRWGNDEMEARHGFRLPVEETVEADLAAIAKFQPPNGQIMLAFDGDVAFGIACLQRIGPETAEIKRMYVQPAHRGRGVGRSLVDSLVRLASVAGYERLRLDSPDFMTAAHSLYRSAGFMDIEPYAESEVPEEYRPYWVFMERRLRESGSPST
jgi:GNAT superfamily N-acetyltransferase